MVEGGRTKTSALQRLARWPTHSPSSSMANWSDSKKHSASLETSSFQPIDYENLVQGSIYIMKVKIVTISLFEGWNDDMCCFSVLRSDTGSMRWSEARYLPGDFDAFDAFDDAGNPPVYFWTRYLRIQVPVNWFSLFEEARRRQRMWTMDIQRHYLYQQQQEQQQDQEQQHDDEDDMLSFPAPPSSISSLPLNNNDINDKKQGEDKQTNNKSTVYPDNDPPSHNMGTSFSQLRHGVPLKPPSPTTAAAAAAFPSSYSTSSSFSVDPQPKNSNDRQSDTNDQHLIYSPAPSIQHATSNIATTSRTTTTTLLSDKGSNTPSSSREKNAAMDFLQTEYHPGHSTMTRCPSKTTRRSLSINLPTNKKQQHRKSVLGLF